MAAYTFEDMAEHVGHEIQMVMYGDDVNVAVECVDCSMVLFDLCDDGEHFDKLNGE